MIAHFRHETFFAGVVKNLLRLWKPHGEQLGLGGFQTPHADSLESGQLKGVHLAELLLIDEPQIRVRRLPQLHIVNGLFSVRTADEFSYLSVLEKENVTK